MAQTSAGPQQFARLKSADGRFFALDLGDHRAHSRALTAKDGRMLKVLGWIVLIIFLIGLLVVIGVFDFIF